MIFNVYAIQDKRIKRFNPRLLVKTETPEQVAEICREGYLTAPGDQREPYLDLYKIGEFDTVEGRIIPVSPQLVCSNSVFQEECDHVFKAKPAQADDAHAED